MDIKVIPAMNYLDEYRQKYKPIGSETISQPPPKVVYSTDVQSLLSRYLGGEKTGSASSSQSDVQADAETTQNASNDGIYRSATANSEEKLYDSGDEDIFDDGASNTLLPTTMFSQQRRITVDEVMRKDSQLNMRCLRRHSSPNNQDSTHNIKRVQRRSSSSPDGQRLLSDSALPSMSSKQRSKRRNSDMSLKSLRRQDSSLSNISCDSNGSSRSNISYKNDLLELSDEDYDFDLEIDLSSSKQNDADSQKLFSLFQLDTDSQKDTDSLTGYDEVDGNCIHCRPPSARSANSADSTGSICAKCVSLKKERYATIKEILESELSYLKDLQLIKKHFYDSLIQSGLLSSTDVSTMFGNISQLISVSQKFCDQLSDHLQHLQSEGDDCYNNAAIGQLVCDSSAMFLAFEAYCLNYGVAVATVDQLKKDNQLFHLFLEASQTDNVALRRMDIKTFLMLPVQRVMKYPLLLKRLHKATHLSHSDREAIEKANEKLTNILHHINAQSKVLSSMFANPKDNNKSTKRTSFEIALTKLVLDSLSWKHDEIHFVRSGRLGYLQPAESQWTEKLRNLRLNTAYAVFVTKGKRGHLPKTANEGRLIFPHKTVVTDAALLIVKKGSSKLQVIGEPYYMARCLISRNSEFFDVFEISKDYVKEPCIIRPVHSSEAWYRNLKYYSMVLGGRNNRRRNALPNILLHTQS